MNIKIGVWHETTQKRTQHTSYAADYIEHETITGNYDLILSFVGGYLIPMPYWLLVSIDSNIIDGRLYAGFGGVNFASEQIKPQKSQYSIQMYAYQLKDLQKEGIITLDSQWSWLVNDNELDYIKSNNITWDYLRQFEKK